MKHLCLTDRCEMSGVINLIRGTHINLTYYGDRGTFDLCAHKSQTGGGTILTREHESPLDAYAELRERMEEATRRAFCTGADRPFLNKDGFVAQYPATEDESFVPTMKALETQDAVFTETPNGFTVTFK